MEIRSVRSVVFVLWFVVLAFACSMPGDGATGAHPASGHIPEIRVLRVWMTDGDGPAVGCHIQLRTAQKGHLGPVVWIDYPGVYTGPGKRGIVHNQDRTIYALHFKAAIPYSDVYLAISTRQGIRIIKDFDKRFAMLCRRHGYHADDSIVQVDGIQGRVLDVEAGRWPYTDHRDRARVRVAEDGGLRLLWYRSVAFRKPR